MFDRTQLVPSQNADSINNTLSKLSIVFSSKQRKSKSLTFSYTEFVEIINFVNMESISVLIIRKETFNADIVTAACF